MASAAITRDSKTGGYLITLNGKQMNYNSLENAQAAARRAQVTATYTEPSAAATLPTPKVATVLTPTQQTARTALQNGDTQTVLQNSTTMNNFGAATPAGVAAQEAMNKQYNLPTGTGLAGPGGLAQTVQTGVPMPTPTKMAEAATPQAATDYLNSLSEAMFKEQSAGAAAPPGTPEAGVVTQNPLDLIQGMINGQTVSGQPAITASSDAGQAPTPLNSTKALADLRQQYGVDPLEQQVASIDSQIAEINHTMQNNQLDEQGKPVSLGVMAGRISTEQRQAQERLAPLLEQKQLLGNQLNQKYNVINTMMDAMKTDYSAAVQAYDSQFNKAMQLTQLLSNQQDKQLSMAEKLQDNARANITVVTNALSSGALDWTKIDPATKAQYTKLELQAGLPTGTIQSFSQKPGSSWAMSTVLPGVDQSGNQIATVIEQNKQTGEFRTTKLTTDYAPKPTSQSVQKGTYVDSKGNQVAWQVDNGKVTSTVIGKSNANLNNPDAKAQNTFDTYRAALIKNLNTLNQYQQPNMSYEQAASALKAQYPTLSDDAIKYYLTGGT